MFGQLLRGTIAVGVLLVGLQVIGTILAVAVDTDDVFWLVIGMAIALAISGGAIFVIALVASRTLAPLAAGWLGMAVGRRPYGYGADDGNFSQALGSLLLIVGASVWGYSIWHRGYGLADPFKVVTGLLLIGTAWIIGLAGLIPRLYFGLRPGQAEQSSAGAGELPTLMEQADNLVIGLVCCVMAGMGLAKCTAASVGDRIDAEGRFVLALGDWVFTCVDGDPAQQDCRDLARFTIPQRDHRERRIRLTMSRSCSKVRIKDSAGRLVEPLGDRQKDAFGIPRNGQDPSGHDYVVFDYPAGQTYTIEVGDGPNRSCRPALRYSIEPSSRFGQGAR